MDSQARRRMQNPYRSEVSDDSLVELCKLGDQTAFSELMRRHHSAALKVALLIVRDKSDAEDEVQNAFWKHLTISVSSEVAQVLAQEIRKTPPRKAAFEFREDVSNQLFFESDSTRAGRGARRPSSSAS